MAHLPDQEWFNSHTEPTVLTSFLRPLNTQGLAVSHSSIGTNFNGYPDCRMRLILDSQQPRVILSKPAIWRLSKTANTSFSPPKITIFRWELRSEWFQGMGLVSFVRTQLRKLAVQVGAPWTLEGNKCRIGVDHLLEGSHP
ncbi:hypothetical protein V8E54_004309 [Elaphomyces granulatus]